MLNVQERTLVHRLWSAGPAALFETGYNLDTAKEFLARPDVAAEMALLDAEYKNGATLELRAKYRTRRQLAQLAPGAVAILAHAMAGPTYVRGPDGTILRDARGLPIMQEAGANGLQLRAAEVVMDSLGISGQKQEYRGDVQINALLMEGSESGIVIDVDPSHVSTEQKALSRERVRNAIERFLPQLKGWRDKISETIPLPPIEVEAQTVLTAPSGRVAKRKTLRSKHGPQKAG